MLATGGSAIAALDLLMKSMVSSQKISPFLFEFAAPEGVAALWAAHPDVDIYGGARWTLTSIGTAISCQVLEMQVTVFWY